MVTTALGAAELLMREKLDNREHRKMVDRFLNELQSQEAE
jgi:F0F1-type ATP synthase membrane subunit b/b'